MTLYLPTPGRETLVYAIRFAENEWDAYRAIQEVIEQRVIHGRLTWPEVTALTGEIKRRIRGMRDRALFEAAVNE